MPLHGFFNGGLAHADGDVNEGIADLGYGVAGTTLLPPATDEIRVGFLNGRAVPLGLLKHTRAIHGIVKQPLSLPTVNCFTSAPAARRRRR